jgi:beta-ureidopropionase / N-carbamoyl-L-amino-acid hydrolase
MLIKYVLFFSFISLAGFSQSAKSVKDIRVNQDRIEKRIFELAQFGKGPDGKSYRVAFSKADQEGRAYYMGLMKSAGLEVSVDFAGNIIGKRKGKDPSKKPIAFGSHIDMVPDGGNYDGCVGSMGAIEVMEVLKENKIITEHPLELIIFSNEEGGVIGSMAIAGQLKKEGLEVVTNSGLTNRDGIKAIGGNPDSIHLVARKPGDIKAYLELHIEQGGILDEEKVQIGVVEGIVGIDEWEITVEGFANHAGTTPMHKRQDALLAASKLVIAVNEVINSYEGRQVGTVGKVAASPGAYNVIPGKVMLALEIRDLSSDKILKLFRDIEKRAAEIALSTRTKISFRNLNVPAKPALMTNAIQDKITESAKMLGYSYKRMQSGAGHDAQEMAQIAPAGMIFVPSVGGISHSPKEFTKAVDMANGANVLLHTVLALDKQ